MVQGVRGRVADLRLQLVPGQLGIDIVRGADAAGQFATLLQRLPDLHVGVAGFAVGYAGDADLVIRGEQGPQPLAPVGVVRGPQRRLVLDKAVAVAEDPRGLPGLRIALDLARLPVGDLEIAVDAAELQGQRVDGRVGPGAEEDRVVRRGLVQFLARGKPPLAEPRDEDLLDADPLARPQGGRPRTYVSQHVGDRIHLGHLVIEFVHGRRHQVQMRIDQSRQDGFAPQIDLPRLRAGQAAYRLVAAHGDDPVAQDGHRFGQAEAVVDRHDLAVVQDEVRGRGGRGN